MPRPRRAIWKACGLRTGAQRVPEQRGAFDGLGTAGAASALIRWQAEGCSGNPLNAPPILRKGTAATDEGEARAILKDGAVIPALPLFLREDRSFDEQGQRRLSLLSGARGRSGCGGAYHAVGNPRSEDQPVETGARRARGNAAFVGYRQKHPGLARRLGETPAVAEAKTARSLGYDAVLLSPGGLNGYTERQFLSRTRAVGEVMPVVAFYLQRAVGGRAFSFAYWEALCRLPAVAAVKVAPFDRYLTLDVARAASQSGRAEEIALYTGNDDSILTDLLTPFDFGGLPRCGSYPVGTGPYGRIRRWNFTGRRARCAARTASRGRC